MYRLQKLSDSTEDRIVIPEAFALNTGRLPEKVFLLRKKLYLKAKKEKKFRFGLVPVRSPLLGESRLISVPPGT